MQRRVAMHVRDGQIGPQFDQHDGTFLSPVNDGSDQSIETIAVANIDESTMINQGFDASLVAVGGRQNESRVFFPIQRIQMHFVLAF